MHSLLAGGAAAPSPAFLPADAVAAASAATAAAGALSSDAADERLRVQPLALRCVSCQERLERRTGERHSSI